MPIKLLRRFILVALISLLTGFHAGAEPASALKLEKTVALPNVAGRMDHFAFDLRSQRLFVAALENNTVEVVDVRKARWLHSIDGQQKPQGVLLLPEQDRLFVANGGDGTCRIFDASTYQAIRVAECGADADNLRADFAARRVYAGYGSGSLAILDFNGRKLGDIRLDAHPESFQLEKGGPRIFVNLPDSKKIAVVDRVRSVVLANWSTGAADSNFPMALDEAGKRLFVVCRRPATLLVIDTSSGAVVQQMSAVGDADDIFYDSRLRRLYASGGQGAITVYRQEDVDHYHELATIQTVPGARTSLFSPESSRLFLAVPRHGREPAAIRIYQTLP